MTSMELAEATEELRKSSDAARSTAAQLARRLSVKGNLGARDARRLHGDGESLGQEDLQVLAEQLEAQVSAWLEKCDKDASALSEERRRIRKARKDLDELKEALHEGMNRLSEGRQEMTQIQAKFAVARNEIAAERKRLADDWTKLGQAQDQAARDATATREKATDSTAVDAQEANAKLMADNSRLAAQLREEAEDREELAKQLETEKTERNALQDAADALRDDLDAARRELKAAQAEAAHRDAEHQALAEKLDIALAEKEALKTEVNALHAGRAEIEDDLAALRVERDLLEKKLAAIMSASAAAAAAREADAEAIVAHTPENIQAKAKAVVAQTFQPKGEDSGGASRSSALESKADLPLAHAAQESHENCKKAAAAAAAAAAVASHNAGANATVNEEMVYLQVENQILIDQNTALRRQVKAAQAELASIAKMAPPPSSIAGKTTAADAGVSEHSTGSPPAVPRSLNRSASVARTPLRSLRRASTALMAKVADASAAQNISFHAAEIPRAEDNGASPKARRHSMRPTFFSHEARNSSHSGGSGELLQHQASASSEQSLVSRASSLSRKTGYVMMADGLTITNDIRWVRQYLVVSGCSFAVFPSKRVYETCAEDDHGRWMTPSGFLAIMTAAIDVVAPGTSIPSSPTGTSASDDSHEVADQNVESKKDVARMHLLVGPEKSVQKLMHAKRRTFDRRSPPFLFRAAENELAEWCDAVNDAITSCA